MYLQWVFVPIVWLVFAMWVMPAKRLHSVAGRGVLAVGLVLAVGVYRGSWCTCKGVFVPAVWGMPAKRFVLGSGERCTCSKIDNIHKLYACIDNIHVLYTRIAGNGNVNARYSGFYWLSTPNTSTPNTSMPNSDTGACYYLNFLRAC